MGGAPTLPTNLFQQTIVVGVGDVAAGNNPGTILSTYALGSCIGLVLFDPVACAGGLLHLMLPDSQINPKKAAVQPAMFADTGLNELLRLLSGFKTNKVRLKAFIAGGACVSAQSDIFKIGERNSTRIKALLAQERIPIISAEVGGTNNRTLHFNIKSGTIDVRTCGSLSKEVSFH